jgi:chromosome segregation ATPase
MGLFSRKPEVTSADLAELKSSLSILTSELAVERQKSQALQQRVDELEQRPLAEPPEPGASLDDVRKLVDDSATQSREHEAAIAELRASAAGVDQRLAEVSETLTRQIEELGNERRDGTSGAVLPDDVATLAHVDELKKNQVRIANEQARYEIAIRADLATLAEQLRRPKP